MNSFLSVAIRARSPFEGNINQHDCVETVDTVNTCINTCNYNYTDVQSQLIEKVYCMYSKFVKSVTHK